MSRNWKNVTARFLIHTLELKLWHFEVSAYVCMWKPCVCNVSPPTLREYALFRKLVLLAKALVWFLGIFFCLVSVLSKKRQLCLIKLVGVPPGLCAVAVCV